MLNIAPLEVSVSCCAVTFFSLPTCIFYIVYHKCSIHKQNDVAKVQKNKNNNFIFRSSSHSCWLWSKSTTCKFWAISMKKRSFSLRLPSGSLTLTYAFVRNMKRYTSERIKMMKYKCNTSQDALKNKELSLSCKLSRNCTTCKVSGHLPHGESFPRQLHNSASELSAKFPRRSQGETYFHWTVSKLSDRSKLAATERRWIKYDKGVCSQLYNMMLMFISAADLWATCRHLYAWIFKHTTVWDADNLAKL